MKKNTTLSKATANTNPAKKNPANTNPKPEKMDKDVKELMEDIFGKEEVKEYIKHKNRPANYNHKQYATDKAAEELDVEKYYARGLLECAKKLQSKMPGEWHFFRPDDKQFILDHIPDEGIKRNVRFKEIRNDDGDFYCWEITRKSMAKANNIVITAKKED